MTPVDVPTPHKRSTTSAITSSNTGARIVVADMANQRRQRDPRSVGTASVICGPAGTVVTVDYFFSTKLLGLYYEADAISPGSEKAIVMPRPQYSKCVKESFAARLVPA